jgi:hypothetical protein
VVTINFVKAHEKQLGLFRCTLVLTIVLLSIATSLFADTPAPKTVTLCFKSYEGAAMDGKFVFYITSSEVQTEDWHPGVVDKSYKIGDAIGSFKIFKFIPLKGKGGGDTFDDNDKSVLILTNSANPPAKVALTLGQNVTAPAK